MPFTLFARAAHRSGVAPLALALALPLASLLAASCGSKAVPSFFEPDSGAGADATADAGGTFDPDAPPPPPASRNDFGQPVIDQGAPSNAPHIFDTSDIGGAGPCLFEPEMGSLFPNNWLRPRFRFTTGHAENLFEITLVVQGEDSPLRIYTTKSGYTMDASTWGLLGFVGIGKVHVKVRSAVVTNGALTDGPWKGSEGDVEIAPVGVTGSVVYWTTSNGTVLKGFKMGSETVQSVITTAQAQTQCVACHTSTPDGTFLALTASSNANNGNQYASIDVRSVDGNATTPSFVTADAKALMARGDQHAAAFSKAHWTAGDHTMLSMLNTGGATQIIWTDLEAKGQAQGTAWDILARTGDPHPAAAAAAFTHDGKTVIYTSTSGSEAGMNTHDGVLYTVPYNDKKGGTAVPVQGASDGAYHHYYPTYSADDQLIAFTRVPQVTDTTASKSYNNPLSEVFILPSPGGTAVRIAANDPPECLNTKSPGITNSWPKWSPEVKTDGGKTYYFLVFSSTRNAATQGPQLYVAPIVVEAGKVTTYSALYLWNQPELEHNHTPAWDVLTLPPPK
jgi:hypothetical protein